MRERLRPPSIVCAVTVVVVLSVVTWVAFLGWSDEHPVWFWWQRVGALCTITVAAAVGVRWLGPWWAWLATSVPLAAVGAYDTFRADALGLVGALFWGVYALIGTGVVVAVVTGVLWVVRAVRRHGVAVRAPRP